MKLFSLIICTYNRDAFLYDALECIANNNFDSSKFEIVLVNNNSTDSTAEECVRFESNFPKLNFRYFLELQQGLSYARNRGIAESTGKYLVFLDDDSFVERDYLANLETYLTENSDATAFGGKIIARYETGIEPKWMTPWGQSWVSAINLGNKVCLFEGKQYPIGANMGFRRDVIDNVGNFNVNLGRTKKNLLAGEEKDLFERIKSIDNSKIYYFPNALVHHVIPPQRTTKEYIVKMAQGVGISEKIRSKAEGTYINRLFSELIKWCATIVLWFFYAIKLQFIKGNYLVIFRYNVSKKLF